MKSKKGNKTIVAFLLLVAVLFIAIMAKSCSDTYNKRASGESFTQPDFNSMQKYSAENVKAVMDALKSGKASKLDSLLIDPDGSEAVINFADWKNADFDNAVSLGAGSLTAAPDDKGQMDISERIFVDVGEVRYVLFVETLTSRWGMNNEGVTAVGVTTYGHFDGLDYGWNGEADDQSALAGQLFWNKEENKDE